MTKQRPEIIVCKEEHEISGGRVRFLGAINSVTPVMTLVEIDGITLLIDCGADLNQEFVELPDEAYEVDAVILTHGHFDHVNGFPALLASGFHAPVFGTSATLAVSRIVLGDGIRLKGGQHRDVRAFLGGFDHIVKTVNYDEAFKPLAKREVEVTLRQAGHIIGSASVEIKTPGNRIIISGDLGRKGAPLLPDFNTTWDDSQPVDLVVMESTFADTDYAVSAEEDILDGLFKIIEDARKEGGHVLVPAFSVGRAQTVIYYIQKLVDAGRIKELPIALDTPMGLKISEDYSAFSALYEEDNLDVLSRNDDPLEFKDLYNVRRGKDAKRLRDMDQTLVIIAGYGMCNGGRMMRHLKGLLPYCETKVLFLSFQEQGSTGQKIIAAAAKGEDGPSESVNIQGVQVPVRADMRFMHCLSEHADKKDLADWLDAIPNVKKVALHHGTEEAQAAFAKWYSEK